MSQHGLLMKKQQQQQQQLHHHHSFPSPITPTYDRKVFPSPSSSSTGSASCRYDGAASSSSGSAHLTEASSAAAAASRGYTQYPFNDIYGTASGNFLSSSYAAAAAAALGTSHHELTRSSCSALPSPTIYPPTPPPSAPWVHPAWFGSMETAAAAAGFMKTPKTNPFDI